MISRSFTKPYSPIIITAVSDPMLNNQAYCNPDPVFQSLFCKLDWRLLPRSGNGRIWPTAVVKELLGLGDVEWESSSEQSRQLAIKWELGNVSTLDMIQSAYANLFILDTDLSTKYCGGRQSLRPR